MTIRVKARMMQSMDGDRRHVKAHFSVGGAEDDGPGRGQFGWRALGILAMPLDEWRMLRHVITVPDCPSELGERVGPQVSVMIEEHGLPENDIGVRVLAEQEADQLRQYEVLEELVTRREAQDRKHGGPSHDDQHVRRDWLDFIRQWSGKANQADQENDAERYEQELIDIAALAIAAVESSRRKRSA